MRTRPAPSEIRSTVRSVVVAATLVLALPLLAACSDEGASVGVASVAGTGATATAAPSASGDAEKQLLDYVECLRGQGLDVPDPTVDADGNLVLGPGGGGNAQPPQIDRDSFAKAQEVCGDVPTGALGLDDQDMTEIQDAALAFAKCMRAEGVDVPDPDFSGGLGQGASGRPFGDLDTDDPKVSAALEKCQSELGDLRPGGGRSSS